MTQRTLIQTMPAVGAKASSKRRRVWLPLWFLLPSILILLALQLYPAVYAAYLSFGRVRRGDVEFIGLANYQRLFTSATFIDSLQRTVIFVACFVIFTAGIGLLLAMLLNRRLKLSGVYLVLLFIPWVLSDVVAGTMWRWLFQPTYGLLQTWVHDMFPFVTDSVYTSQGGSMFIVIVASIWQALPFATILSLGALQTVPQDIIEAAAIDGANRWQRFWRVIVPICRSTLLIMVLLLSIRSVNSAGLIFATTSGGPGDATTTTTIYLLKVIKEQGNFGLGGAISMVLLGVNVILAALYLRLFGKQEA
ncbi:MAG: sugar ABC transporter permease [Anaerolineae bacterium]|nr:sugar ABC transporter permease [Anaerolineae bacterium]